MKDGRRLLIRRSTLEVQFDLFLILLRSSLRLLNHCHRSHENDTGNDLMGMKRGMKETPGDTDSGEGLHHFEVAGGRSSSQAQTFEVDKQWNTARDRSEQKQRNDCCSCV